MQMPTLNLPTFSLKTRITGNRAEIFDPVRKLYVALTPEEWVRQHVINYLIADRLVPPGLIAVEKEIKVNRLSRRCDIIVFSKTGSPLMVVECKAPGVKITQDAFNQAMHYNLSLKIKFMLLTNGLKHFCFQLDYETQSSRQTDYIPSYNELSAI
jgi:hypothetical protein